MSFSCLVKVRKENLLCLFGLHFDGNEFFSLFLLFFWKCGCYRARVIVNTDEV